MLSRTRRQRLFTVALVLLTAPALLELAPPVSASAAPRGVVLPQPPANKRVDLTRKAPAKKTVKLKPYPKFDPTGHAVLPGATTAKVVSVSGAAGRASVTTAPEATAQAAGVHGVLFSLRGATGKVDVRVDPTSFRNAYGGGFSSRLRLVAMPDCALTTPSEPQCQTQTPLRTPVGSPLSAEVTLTAGTTVLAAAAAVSGPTGDYGATSLSPGGSWSVSGNTGSFGYGYPITVPPAIGGAAPSVTIGYSSASQDARTEGTNNQSSWLGDGWSSSENYIERTYKSCSDVKAPGAPKDSGDLCWAGQILTLSLNGTSTAIVYDDGAKTFRPVDDGATTKIENLTNGTNGTKNGEYFKVTQGGTQYYFGLDRLPGWSANKEETNSAWTVPVYKAHGGVSACPDSTTFADTACTLGYRFNLDYVVDLNNNAMAYYYEPEAGFYGPNMKNTAISYVRGGTLKRIDYGMTASTVFSPAPEQIVFDTDERCLSPNPCDDAHFTVDHPEYWPDTPVDLNCKSGSTNCTNHGPSFWSRKRLTTITTQVRVGGAVKPVDRYEFHQTFPDGGDHAPTLWLESIKHTGLDRLGGAAADADAGTVTFNPLQIANRVGTVPGLPRMYFNRIQNIVTETGAETVVAYNTPDCSGVPASDLSDANDTAAQAFAAANTTGCFPVYWTPEAQPRPLIDWFYTHPVKSVTTTDKNNRYQDGSQPTLLTEYTYKGTPGWHYDDNETVKDKNRTWGQFRGYPEVDVTTGNTGVFHYTDGTEVYDRKTLTKTFYFLGLEGDTLPGGKKRDVPALTSQDGSVSVTDNNAYAGQVFETLTYTGDGGSIDHGSVSVPTLIGPTASRARTGLPALTAQMVRTVRTIARRAVSSGWRKTEKATFYNTSLGQTTTGMEVQAADRGETGAAGNAPTCSFKRYLDGKTATLVVLAEEIVTDQDCAAAGASPSGNLISDVRTSYDGNAFAYNGDGQASPAKPGAANASLVQEASTSTGTTVTAFVDTSKTTYDSYGRVTATVRTPKSGAQNVYTVRTPATGALPSSITTVKQVTAGADCSKATVSSTGCHVSSVVQDEARQLPRVKTDVAGSLTSTSYDALGRLTAVWLPNKSKAAGAPANMTFGYKLSTTGPNVVTTNTLVDNPDADAGPTYRTSKVLHDALLRKLETQDVGENATVIVTDIQYDSHGWQVLSNNGYAAVGTPSDALFSDHLSQVSVPATTVIDHDALGRTTQVTEEHTGVKTRMTRTAYTGDSTVVVPPVGAMATRQTENARGQTTQLEQFTTAPRLTGTVSGGFVASGGISQNIKYTYTPAGQQSTVTGPDSAVWTFKYDLRGRQTSLVDPDTGTNLTGYDDADNIVTTKDARGGLLDYTYDLLGRKLTAVDRSKNNFKYASWQYDTLRIGELTSSTRYVSGVTGEYKMAVTGYSTLGSPLGQTISLPTAEQPLPTEYTTTFAYTPNVELLAQQVDPAIGGVPGETINYGYNLLGAATSTVGIDRYVSDTTYTDLGKLSMVTMGPETNKAEAIYGYEDETLRLSSRTVSRNQGIGPTVDQSNWTYDEAGNPLSLTDKQSETGNIVTDAQCYRYDGLSRLVDAWTAKGTCAEPTASTVATGAGSYWQTFGYNEIGDRTKLVEHSTNGGADTTTTYINGCKAACNRTGAQPHTLTATTGGADPTSLVYDVSGNLLTRTPTTAPGQTLKWDDEGRLAEVATTGSAPTTTKYLYDADGNQLIRRDPGKTTLFAGDTQVVIDTSKSPAVLLGAVRTYAHGGTGAQVAVRSTLPGGGTDYLFNDPHGTSTLAVDTTSLEVSRQQYKPYGEPRNTANPTLWPDLTKGYLGAPKDAATGYTDLGARKYDPALGRFISADPILDPTDVNQLGGYTYAADNPISGSDPSGLRTDTYDPPSTTAIASDPHARDKYNSDPGPRYNGGTTGGRGHSNEKKYESCYATCDGQQVLYKHLVLPASMPKAKQDRIIAKFYEKYRYLWCYSNGFCYQDAEEMMPSQFLNMLKGVCHSEGGCGEDIDKQVSFPALLLAGAKDGMLSGGEGSTGGRGPSGFERGGGKAKATAEKPQATSCNSFSPDTGVLMADHTIKPIRDIRVGDKVLATDPENADPEIGDGVAKTVTELHDNVDQELIDLEVVDEWGNRATVHTTGEHPFWSEGDQAWVNARALTAGTALHSVDHPDPLVARVHAYTSNARMLNLTVADMHTYYVLAGNTPILVHNGGGDDYNQARNKALAWLDERGFVAERTTIGKFGTIAGQPIGMQTADGRTGFRIEFDERSGAHINVWSGKEKGPHFNFDASEATVTKIQGQFGCK